jgi:hypothetical protein
MKSRIVLAAGALMLMAGMPLAWAHDTGHESRTPAQCEKLPGTAKEGERGHCLECVARKEKHHYHPDYKEGERCRPDNGKP